MFNVIIPCYLALETFPADFTWNRVNMGTVDLNHVELQGSVSQEVFATAGADVLHH